MSEILLNPITISVVVMCVLCLIKINVILSVVAATLVAGFCASMNISDIMSSMISGMSDNGETALGYLLLGIFAAALAHTGLTGMVADKLSRVLKGNKLGVNLALLACSVISGTIIPVHIAFIPILVPPLLGIMNDMKLDRRSTACAMSFGLLAPYVTIPIGYGLIFHNIIAANMTKNGMPLDKMDVYKYTWILAVGLIIGLVLAMMFYNKDRTYEDANVEWEANVATKLGYPQLVSIAAIVATLVVQLVFSSLPLGAIAGLFTIIAFGGVKLKDVDDVVQNGIGIMGMISFVMFVSGGYTTLISSTGSVERLVNASLQVLGDSKPIFVGVLIIIGLIIVTGLGTSFGTVPILAVLYVPMCLEMNLSVGATCCLITCASALGDAGSPASDTALGPTAGLNADGQHDHIWDTCVPSFIFFNVPLAIAGFIGAMIF